MVAGFRFAVLRFVHDQFACGRRFRILNIVDDVTRECLAAIPDTSISGRRVARELTTLIERRGRPGMIVSELPLERHWSERQCRLTGDGAIRLSWVRPAMKDCVPQAPTEAAISKRLPHKLRPRRRVRLVLTEVSSINTSRSGCACILGMRYLNQSCRRCFTRLRSRSVANQ